MQGRNFYHYQPRIKISTVALVASVATLAFYIFIVQQQEANSDREMDRERCKSELSSLKYQLSSVLKYKNTMESVINDIQQDCSIQKQSAKDFSHSYVLMKTHLEMCEKQTDALEVECKDLKAKLEKTNAELRTCKKAPG